MAYYNKELLLDSKKKPIPQYYDPAEDVFKPLTNPNAGTKLEQQFTESDAVSGTLTFSKNVTGIGIYNRDTVNDGKFNVNGLDIHVPAGEYVEFNVGGNPSKTVKVTLSTKYIISRFE